MGLLPWQTLEMAVECLVLCFFRT